MLIAMAGLPGTGKSTRSAPGRMDGWTRDGPHPEGYGPS